MSLTGYDNGNMVMPVSPMGNYGSNGFGFGGDGAWWLLVLFLFMFNGNGYGNGFGGNGGEIQRGFDQQSVMNGINGLTTAVSNGFANAEVSRCNGQMNILQTLNANQNAMTQGMNTLAMSLQNCCCENRAAVADLKYTIATEACADRAAVKDGIQVIMDKLCQQEIDALKTQNANLQTQINLANMQASQTAQTAKILADNAAQTQALEQYLNPVPIPAYTVQNPNCCGNFGYGCGCNG
jgi:hypothetical protein